MIEETEEMEREIETWTLTSGETTMTSVKALMFGRLMDKAVEAQTSYRSDWYHDVQWIDWFMEGKGEGEGGAFFYAASENGTSIGLDPRVVVQRGGKMWMVVLWQDGQAWKLEMARMDPREVKQWNYTK